jgi:hypothetical protein
MQKKPWIKVNTPTMIIKNIPDENRSKHSPT